LCCCKFLMNRTKFDGAKVGKNIYYASIVNIFLVFLTTK
jgi:hypothetical protein